MKLSQLKQLIREELVKELGFDYPNKPKAGPSQYQNGIIDTIAAIRKLGHDVDVEEVMNILYPDDTEA